MSKYDKQIFNKEGKQVDPRKNKEQEEKKREAKKKALREASDNLPNAILKGMADKVNNAESKAEEKKAEERFNKYKKLLENK